MDNLERLLEWLQEGDYKEREKFGLDFVLNEPSREKIPHEKMNLHKNEGYHNILTVLKKATKDEIDYWSNWYQHAHAHVAELAQRYDLPLPVTAAVVAVLSPNLGWRINLMAAQRLIENWLMLEGEKDLGPLEKVPAYKTNVYKALKILDTGDVGIVKGPKVSVFFHSLLNPDRVERELVLDGHAINVWRGIKTPLKNLKQPNKLEREAIIHDYKKVADLVGLTPQQLQAVTWFIWKSVKNPPKVHGKFKTKKKKISKKKEPGSVVEGLLKFLLDV